MSDPKRLLDSQLTDEASSLERELLASLSPSAQDREQVLAGVLAQAGLAATVVAGGAVLASKGTAAGTSLLTKITITACVALPLAGAGIVAGGFLMPAAPPPPSAPVTTPADASPELPTSVPPEAPSPAVAPRTAAPETRLEAPPPKIQRQAKKSESDLVVEDRLLRGARSAMKGGDTARALSLLDEMERRFPQGTLAQERELLRISVLRASGKDNEASQNSDQFRDRYPDSPYDVPGANKGQSAK